MRLRRYYDAQLARFTQPEPSGLDFLGLGKEGWGNALSIAGTVVGAAALAPVGGVGVAVGAAALSTGLGVAGGALGKTATAVDRGYSVGGYVGGAAIGG
ncbi:hypothetical protein ACIPSH_18185 [Streptomyces iakyrus]|uniref:hypothetical protein n=1 Tax=Streptomyces iakyrus TaxID=68219 RepID=UPI003821971F